MGAVASFFYNWYSKGIYTVPPPCLFSRTFRRYFNDNKCGGPIACANVSKWGTSWGERNRSPIMFFAFWLSIAALALYGVGFASLSTRAQHLRDAAWAVATVDATVNNNNNNNNDDKVRVSGTFYFGLRALVSDCNDHKLDLCQEETVAKWDEAACTESFCSPCHEASDGTLSSAFFSVFSMIPQLLVNLQRSTPHGDLNCQKWVGISAAFFGTISTLFAILQYYRGCYLKIPDELSNGVSFQHRLGTAYYCMLVATLLKPFDFWANIIVPVPKQGFWDPDAKKIHSSNDAETAVAATATVAAVVATTVVDKQPAAVGKTATNRNNNNSNNSHNISNVQKGADIENGWQTDDLVLRSISDNDNDEQDNPQQQQSPDSDIRFNYNSNNSNNNSNNNNNNNNNNSNNNYSSNNNNYSSNNNYSNSSNNNNRNRNKASNSSFDSSTQQQQQQQQRGEKSALQAAERDHVEAAYSADVLRMMDAHSAPPATTTTRTTAAATTRTTATRDIPLASLPPQTLARDVMIVDGQTISAVEYGSSGGEQ